MDVEGKTFLEQVRSKRQQTAKRSPELEWIYFQAVAIEAYFNGRPRDLERAFQQVRSQLEENMRDPELHDSMSYLYQQLYRPEDSVDILLRQWDTVHAVP